MTEKFKEFLNICGDEIPDNSTTIYNLYEEGFKQWFERYKNGDKSLEDNLSGIQKNSLSNDEAFYILAYTGSSSRWLNSDLRNNVVVRNVCKQLYIDNLNNSLDKVAPFNNGIVYHMDSPSAEDVEILDWFESKIGRKFKIPFFLSTSKEDYKNSPIVWEIETLKKESYGKDISNITNNKYEYEVLFRTESCFEIKRVNREKQYIYLKEVEADSNCDFNLTGLYHLNI